MPPRTRCLIAQPRKVIIGMRFDVVAANGYPGDVGMCIGNCSQFTFHRLDVRAVVACEDDNARSALGEGSDRRAFAIKIREGDIGRVRSSVRSTQQPRVRLRIIRVHSGWRTGDLSLPHGTHCGRGTAGRGSFDRVSVHVTCQVPLSAVSTFTVVEFSQAPSGPTRRYVRALAGIARAERTA